jgi:hypothetical protein
VQLHLTLPSPTTGRRAWEWNQRVGNLELADAEDNTYKPIGAWVRATSKTFQDYIVASFNNAGGGFSSIEQQNGKLEVMDIWIAFWVPRNTKIQELRLSGTAVLEDFGFKAAPVPIAPSTSTSTSSPAGSGAGQ